MNTLEEQLNHLPIIRVGDSCQRCGAKKDMRGHLRPPGETRPEGFFGSCNIDSAGNVTDCDQCRRGPGSAN